MRGDGSVYKRKRSQVWYFQWHENGICKRESSKSKLKSVAQAKLRERIAANQRGERPSHKLVNDIWPYALSRWQKGQNHAALNSVKSIWPLHLQPFFGKMKLTQVTYQELNRYQTQRINEGAAGGTINRELSKLKTALTEAVRARELNHLPPFPKNLKENVRQGCISENDLPTFQQLTLQVGGLWLRTIFEIAFVHARRKTEILRYKVRDIDFIGRRIHTGTTKNGKPVTLPITHTMLELLVQCCEGKQPDAFVFTRADGKPVRYFRNRWKTVCRLAGKPELLFHDLRRSGVTHMRRGGMAEADIMAVSGHLSRTTFLRYNITNEENLREDLDRLEEKRQQIVAKQGSTHTSTHTTQETTVN